VLDSTMYLANSPYAKPDGVDSPQAHFLSQRIPGARFLDLDAIGDPAIAPTSPHNLPTAQVFTECMAALGVTRGTPVVVYDHLFFSAPRAWHTLRAFGHLEVAVLQGGLQSWIAEGGQCHSEADPVDQESAPPEEWALLPGRQVAMHQVLANITSQEFQHVDVRAKGRFAAEVPEPREGMRGGHVPNSLNLPFGDLLIKDESGTAFLREPEDLKELIAAAGVAPERPIVASCGSGLTAAWLSLAMNVAHPEAAPPAIYDGSWVEWGGLPETPVATGNK